MADAAKDQGAGHRERLRQRFFKSGLDGFHDYEVVELLLTLGSPRRDCKIPAKDAIKRFGSLQGVLEASPEELQRVTGIGPRNAFGVRLVRAVAQRYLKERIINQPVYTSAQDVFDYLYHDMKGLRKEVFKVLFLNAQNQIIAVEDLFQGTVDGSFVSSREIIEGALKHHATGMIFVHNHPSGNPEPSPSDLQVTRDLVYVGNIAQLRVLDHIIIGDGVYYSFAAEGLIEEYRLQFMNLKMAAEKPASTGRRLRERER
jgi:DNA repair protein RadC